MREHVITYKDDDYDVEIVVRQATLKDSFKRVKLRSREEAQMKARDAEVQSNPLMMWTAFRALPDCLGATIKIRNLDESKTQLSDEITFAEFLELPEAMIILWQEATYECNPQWLPRPKEEKQGEAKEPGDNSNSTENSSPGSKEESPKKSPNGT